MSLKQPPRLGLSTVLSLGIGLVFVVVGAVVILLVKGSCAGEMLHFDAGGGTAEDSHEA